MKVLTTNGLMKMYGGLRAVYDFNFTLTKGELAGLIGPNGAGKTTVFNMLTNVHPPTKGRIYLNTSIRENKEVMTDITYKKPYKITQMGIARTFQNIRLFNELSALDNVKIAYHANIKFRVGDSIFRTAKYYKGEKEMEDKAISLMEIFDLQDKRNELAKNLPYGQQRKLEIVRALASDPFLLLLDEPAAGMNPQETLGLMDLIHFIRDKFNLTILLIEHDMNLVMGICERIIVLDYGQIIAEGTPKEISRNPDVIKAYLGEEVE